MSVGAHGTIYETQPPVYRDRLLDERLTRSSYVEQLNLWWTVLLGYVESVASASKNNDSPQSRTPVEIGVPASQTPPVSAESILSVK